MANSQSVDQEAFSSLALAPLRLLWRTFLIVFILVIIAMVVQVGWAISQYGLDAPSYTKALLIDTYEASRNKDFAAQSANIIYTPLFEMTGLVRLTQQAMNIQNETILHGGPVVLLYPYVLTAMYATKLIGIRLGQLAVDLVLIALLTVVAMVDGLVCRQIRKSNAEKESGTLYALSRKLFHISLPFMAIIYCSIPLNINASSYIVIIVGLLMIGSAWVQGKYYKKHV